MLCTWAASSASADLPGDLEHLVHWDGAQSDPIGERRAVHIFDDECAHAAPFLKAVEQRDVRMVERSQHPRLSGESGNPLGIVSNSEQQHLERDLAMEARVSRPWPQGRPQALEEPRRAVGHACAPLTFLRCP